jgi:hypothetical protein
VIFGLDIVDLLAVFIFIFAPIGAGVSLAVIMRRTGPGRRN